MTSHQMTLSEAQQSLLSINTAQTHDKTDDKALDTKSQTSHTNHMSGKRSPSNSETDSFFKYFKDDLQCLEGMKDGGNGVGMESHGEVDGSRIRKRVVRNGDGSYEILGRDDGIQKQNRKNNSCLKASVLLRSGFFKIESEFESLVNQLEQKILKLEREKQKNQQTIRKYEICRQGYEKTINKMTDTAKEYGDVGLQLAKCRQKCKKYKSALQVDEKLKKKDLEFLESTCQRYKQQCHEESKKRCSLELDLQKLQFEMDSLRKAVSMKGKSSENCCLKCQTPEYFDYKEENIYLREELRRYMRKEKEEKARMREDGETDAGFCRERKLETVSENNEDGGRFQFIERGFAKKNIAPVFTSSNDGNQSE